MTRDKSPNAADGPLDPTRVSFSQAQGYESLPQPLKLEQVSGKARLMLWNYFYLHALHREDSFITVFGPWEEIFGTLHIHFFMLPIDDFDKSLKVLHRRYRAAILNDLPFNKLFDLLQMIMRHRECPKSFIDNVAQTFRSCRLAYVVDTQRPVTILPAVTEQEGQVLLAATKQLQTAGLAGSIRHLRRASHSINQSDWTGSIRESIHAVESVARQLDPKASATLGPALKSLERQGGLHPALKDAFSKLYGYTSDEQGIRHAYLEDTESKSGLDEAVFMLSACAAFASYLSRQAPGSNVGSTYRPPTMHESKRRRTSLGDCAVMNESTYSQREAWPFINYLDTGNITENCINEIQHLVVGKDKIPSRARRKARPGDIVYSTVRPNQKHFGLLKEIPDRFLASTGFAVIRGIEGIADSEYIYYFLAQNHIVDYLHAIAEDSTSAYPSIRPADIARLEVDLPPIAEQRAIAHILGTLDDKIELNRRMNQTLEEMARALFKSWFVDFDPVRAKAALKQHALGKSAGPDAQPNRNGAAPTAEWTVESARDYLDAMDPRIVDLFPDRLVDSELGEIPERWVATKLARRDSDTRQQTHSTEQSSTGRSARAFSLLRRSRNHGLRRRLPI